MLRGLIANVAVGLVVAVGMLASAVTAEARKAVTQHLVKGRMAPTAQNGAEHGAFAMKVVDYGNGGHFERIEASAKGLNVSGASATNPPNFHVFLIKSDGSGAADFGRMRVNKRGKAGFVFDTRKASTSLPSGVNTIKDFGGGTIEVRDASGSAVCAGTIPVFRTFGKATTKLHPVPQNFKGLGEIRVHRQALPNGTHEEMEIACVRMGRQKTFTAVAIDASSTETSIGQFTTKQNGMGGLRLKDSNIPGGLDALAGQNVEIRDANGNAVLAGKFPTIP